MHYKDGTPAVLGDIVLVDDGTIGMVLGGTLKSDYCSTDLVVFEKPSGLAPLAGTAVFKGKLIDPDANYTVRSEAQVEVRVKNHVQTRECVKIGHVDIGHG